MTLKREEYISWDSYFMGLAAVASFRSKDPSTQNGVCIVDPESYTPLALGYNGFPRGCSDDEFPWARKADKIFDCKYPYVEHAERNAIYNDLTQLIRNDINVKLNSPQGSIILNWQNGFYNPSITAPKRYPKELVKGRKHKYTYYKKKEKEERV